MFPQSSLRHNILGFLLHLWEDSFVAWIPEKQCQIWNYFIVLCFRCTCLECWRCLLRILNVAGRMSEGELLFPFGELVLFSPLKAHLLFKIIDAWNFHQDVSFHHSLMPECFSQIESWFHRSTRDICDYLAKQSPTFYSVRFLLKTYVITRISYKSNCTFSTY